MTAIITAVFAGVVVLLAGNLPWAGLAPLNFRLGMAVPWAILIRMTVSTAPPPVPAEGQTVAPAEPADHRDRQRGRTGAS